MALVWILLALLVFLGLLLLVLFVFDSAFLLSLETSLDLDHILNLTDEVLLFPVLVPALIGLSIDVLLRGLEFLDAVLEFFLLGVDLWLKLLFSILSDLPSQLDVIFMELNLILDLLDLVVKFITLLGIFSPVIPLSLDFCE